jgi:hypothetical protein
MAITAMRTHYGPCAGSGLAAEFILEKAGPVSRAQE